MADQRLSQSGGAPNVDLSLVQRFWSEFDLDGRRVALDEAGLKIAEHQVIFGIPPRPPPQVPPPHHPVFHGQEEAMQNRKKLAESTKEFRRSYAEDPNAKAYGALLKLYQEEIDRLTKRAKHGEAAFLTIYEKLSEAPDPSPALALAFETSSRATELEAQLRKVSQELAEYKVCPCCTSFAPRCMHAWCFRTMPMRFCLLANVCRPSRPRSKTRCEGGGCCGPHKCGSEPR